MLAKTIIFIFFILCKATSCAIAADSTVAAGSWHTIGVKVDGSVVAVGNNEFGQLDVRDWSLNFKYVFND